MEENYIADLIVLGMILVLTAGLLTSMVSNGSFG